MIEICEKYKTNSYFERVLNNCKEMILIEELNSQYDMNLNLSNVLSTECIRINNNMYIAIFGKQTGMEILNNREQPQNEWLFEIKFPTGAYIFGSDCPKELFNRFYEELKTYNPKFNDDLNHCLYFDLENGSKLYKDFGKIFGKYQEEYRASEKERRIEKLQEEIERLRRT